MSALLQQIDAYCERTDFSLLSEPLNLLSNLAFIVAAGSIHFQVTRLKLPVSRHIYAQIFILYSIGLGSALLHSFATYWAMLADVIPITVFVVYYLWYWLAQCLRVDLRTQLLFGALLALLTYLGTRYLQILPLGGSQSYLGVAILVLALGWHQRKRDLYPPYLLWAGVTFVFSLFFRSIDPYVCFLLPMGTHFLWHILNALVLYRCLQNSLYGEHIRKIPTAATRTELGKTPTGS